MSHAGAFAFAAGCAVLMGFAIQRGSTCMVAAIEEAVIKRRATRVLALLEAALFVGGGLALLGFFGQPAGPAPRYAGVSAALAGGALLGLGAFLNRACAFGTVARLGSGEWSYAAMPVGFYLGCLSATTLLGPFATTSAAMSMAWLATSLAIAFVAVATWRLAGCVRAAVRGSLNTHLWQPQRATVVIAVAFLGLMLAAGAWTYTQWLVDAARGTSPMTGSRIVLFGSLFGGAVLGGWSAGNTLVPPTLRALARSLIGGLAMGVGGQLVPGGNDGLILIGLPHLDLPAILALAVMALTIAAAFLAAGGLAWLGKRRSSA
jgi:uncharacterized membrane protein YedE/YeeE